MSVLLKRRSRQPCVYWGGLVPLSFQWQAFYLCHTVKGFLCEGLLWPLCVPTAEPCKLHPLQRLEIYSFIVLQSKVSKFMAPGCSGSGEDCSLPPRGSPGGKRWCYAGRRWARRMESSLKSFGKILNPTSEDGTPWHNFLPKITSLSADLLGLHSTWIWKEHHHSVYWRDDEVIVGLKLSLGPLPAAFFENVCALRDG